MRWLSRLARRGLREGVDGARGVDKGDATAGYGLLKPYDALSQSLVREVSDCDPKAVEFGSNRGDGISFTLCHSRSLPL